MSDDHREFRYVGAAPNPNLSPHASEKRAPPHAYRADRVFGPDASNEEVVIAASAKDIVAGALRGVNGTIFAYGQTGGGKTHTMRAVTRAAARDVFDAIAADDGDCEYLLHFSAVEIYNEAVRDLLVDAPPPWANETTSASASASPGMGTHAQGGIGVPVPGGVIRGHPVEPTESLRLLDDPERGTVIERLTAAPVDSREALEGLLREVEARRQVGATGMNAHSSRSHQIVRLTVESRRAPRREPRDEGAAEVRTGDVGDFTATPTSAPVDAEKEEEGSEYDSPAESFDEEDASSASARTRRRPGKKSKSFERGVALAATLNFVDLAGSERANRARVSGARLKEGCHINRSLLTLGKVIRGLGERAEEERRESRGDSRAHVPYRDSKLTRILASSLGGNARTAVVTCVSDATSAVEATRAALFFASQAKRVTNRATVNEVRDAEAPFEDTAPRLPSSDEPSPPPSAREPPVEVTIPRSSRRRTRRSRAPKKRRASPISRGKKRALVSAAWNDFYFAEATAATTTAAAAAAAAAGLFPGSPRAHRRQRSWSPSPSTAKTDASTSTREQSENREERPWPTSTPTPLATGSTRTAGCSLVSSVERFVGRFDSRWARRALPRDASRARVDARMRKPSKP